MFDILEPRASTIRVVGPFDFWAAGTDNGVPRGGARKPLWTLLLPIAALAAVVVLVAVFVNRS